MSGPYHPTGRAKVSIKNPQAIGVCQRSGFWYQRAVLRPQYEWAGVKLQNLELYVSPEHYDTPQHQLKTIVIPADPLPVYRPFPEDFAAADAGGGDLTFDPGTLRGPSAAPTPAAPATMQSPTILSGATTILEDVDREPWEAKEEGPLPDLDTMVAKGPARPRKRK